MKWLSTFLVIGFAFKAHPAQNLEVQRTPAAVIVRNAYGSEILQYRLQQAPEAKPSVESACYFHPVKTPKGVVMTEVGPSDHPHHRGIFLAWVEMHGKVDADFWGWGEHAPTKDRVIVNREISDLLANRDRAGFRAVNEWLAETKVVVAEELTTSVSAEGPANVINLNYKITAKDDLTLSRWAFSGFCVRVRKDGKLQAEGPDGPVTLARPKHTDPASDWPTASWYGYTLTMPDGTVAGAAIIDHPKNPPSLWHNHVDVRMLNPCIVAPGAVKLKAGVPITLRYRVVIHDGPTPRPLLNQLAKSWRE